MFANLLIEMLTNRPEDSASLEELDIDSELKCILYECLHAEDKTLKREEDRYHFETKKYIEKESSKNNADSDLATEFKEMIAVEAARAAEDHEISQRIGKKRKPDMPVPNLKNYDAENDRMGVKNEIDLILGVEEKAVAQQMYDKELIRFSHSVGEVKRDKQQKFLTV